MNDLFDDVPTDPPDTHPPGTPGASAAPEAPLAERLRPRHIDEVIGQTHLLGAGKPEEARRTGLRILAIGLVSIGILAICIWPFLNDIAGFIAPRPEVQAEAENYLIYNVLAIPFTLTTMILAGAFGGAWATWYNLVGMGVGTWLVRLPLAWLLGHVLWQNSTGVWVSMLASQACQATILYYIFTRRNWQRFALSKTRNGTRP